MSSLAGGLTGVMDGIGYLIVAGLLFLPILFMAVYGLYEALNWRQILKNWTYDSTLEPVVGTQDARPGTRQEGVSFMSEQLIKQDFSQEFVDRCTARWRFEKTGVRLYDKALIICPPELRADLTRIRDEEKKHEEMLEEVIRSYGSNPHSETPSSRIASIESKGIVDVVENETDFKAVSDALLGAEVIDQEGWELLIDLSSALNDTDTRARFEAALHEEREHLRILRQAIKTEALDRVTQSQTTEAA